MNPALIHLGGIECWQRFRLICDSPTVFLVLQILMITGKPMRRKTLAAEAGFNESTIFLATRTLSEAGLITIIPNASTSSGIPHLCRINDEGRALMTPQARTAKAERSAV